MSKTKSAMLKHFAVSIACSSLLSAAFIAGRYSVHLNDIGGKSSEALHDTTASKIHTQAPLAFDFAMPIDKESTEEGSVFNFHMGFTR